MTTSEVEAAWAAEWGLWERSLRSLFEQERTWRTEAEAMLEEQNQRHQTQLRAQLTRIDRLVGELQDARRVRSELQAQIALLESKLNDDALEHREETRALKATVALTEMQLGEEQAKHRIDVTELEGMQDLMLKDLETLEAKLAAKGDEVDAEHATGCIERRLPDSYETSLDEWRNVTNDVRMLLRTLELKSDPGASCIWANSGVVVVSALLVQTALLVIGCYGACHCILSRHPWLF